MKSSHVRKTSLGLNENIEGLLCYILTWVTGVIFLVLEKDSRYVRFHAIQSIVVFLPLLIISYIIKLVTGYIPVIGQLVSLLLWAVWLILWIVLMYKAYSGEFYKLPLAGDIAEQQLNK